MEYPYTVLSQYNRSHLKVTFSMSITYLIRQVIKTQSRISAHYSTTQAPKTIARVTEPI